MRPSADLMAPQFSPEDSGMSDVEARRHGGYYSDDSYASGPIARKQLPPHRMDVLRLVPWVIMLCCIVMFATPVMLTLHIGRDHNVKYWVGPWCDVVVILPIVFLVTGVMHLGKDLPDKRICAVCLLVPAIGLLILADSVLTVVSDKSDELFSLDCDTFAGKRDLEREWNAASELYNGCIEETLRTVKESYGREFTVAEAKAMYKIQDCEEYEATYLKHQRDWDYLKVLEEEEVCSGWCAPGESLWTYQDKPRDACSVSVSASLSGKVAHNAGQVLSSAIFILAFTCFLLVGVRPILKKHGIKW